MKLSTRLFSWVVTAPITILVVLFAVSNPDPVTLRLRPFPFDITIRLWALTLIQLFIGFLLGAIVLWVSDRGRRRETRALSRRVYELENAMTAAQAPSRTVSPGGKTTNLPSTAFGG